MLELLIPAEHTSLKTVLAVDTLLYLLMGRGTEDTRNEWMCHPAAVSMLCHFATLLTQAIRSDVLCALSCPCSLIPLNFLPVPGSQMSGRCAQAQSPPFLRPSPRNAVCWLPPLSSRFPRTWVKSAESRLFGDAWKEKDTFLAASAQASEEGEQSSLVFYWQKWHSMEARWMVPHSRDVGPAFWHMQVFCAVAEIQEIHSFFFFMWQLIIYLGVELASLNYFTVMKSQTTQN